MKKLIAMLLICGMATFTLTGVTGCGKTDTAKATGTVATPAKSTTGAMPTTGDAK